MYYICKHFELRELVSPWVWNKYMATPMLLWQLADPGMLHVLDRLRVKFGVTYCNTWMWNGVYTLRGYRHPVIDMPYMKAEKIYLELGLHEHFKAYDISFKTASVPDVRQYILSHPKEFPEIKGVELRVSWLHIDCRNRERVITF